MTTSLILPLPPSLNHAYITTRTGKRIMTNECRSYKEAVAWEIKGKIRKPFPKLKSLSLFFYFPNYRRADTDNREKIVIDVLKGTLVEDDCWRCIPRKYVQAACDQVNPRVVVEWEV